MFVFAGKELPPPTIVPVEQGCATIILAALDSSLRRTSYNPIFTEFTLIFDLAQSPAFLRECGQSPTLPYASDRAIARELWALSEKLVGQSFQI